jgi:hypothetical protein
MKAKSTLLFILTLGALQLVPIAKSQPPSSDNTTTSEKSSRHSKMERERRARWASLTEVERAKIRAAHQQAMADPVVQAAHERLKQARKEFREIMRPAMLRADPSIQPLLEKLCPEHAAGE